MKKLWLLMLLGFDICLADPSMNELKGWEFRNATDWVDIACGDYDGDGISEFALLKSAGDTVYFMSSPNNDSLTIEAKFDLWNNPTHKAITRGGLHYE